MIQNNQIILVMMFKDQSTEEERKNHLKAKKKNNVKLASKVFMHGLTLAQQELPVYLLFTATHNIKRVVHSSQYLNRISKAKTPRS